MCKFEEMIYQVNTFPAQLIRRRSYDCGRVYTKKLSERIISY